MKVTNPDGRVYKFYPCHPNSLPGWCSRVEPVTLKIDDAPADFYADRQRSHIYFNYAGTAYYIPVKDSAEFDVVNESTLRITNFGRQGQAHVQRLGDEAARDFQAGTGKRVLTRADIDAVHDLLPRLREAVTARGPDPATNSHEYSSEFRSVVRQIVHEFHTRPFMYAFDYVAWMAEGQRFIEDPEALAAADLETIRKLLVVHWRSDYWDTDNEHWEHIATSGHLTALIERLAEIARDMKLDVTSPRTASEYDREDGNVTDITMPNEAPGPMMLSDLRSAADWLPEVINAVKQERQDREEPNHERGSGNLRSLIEKMVEHFIGLHVFVEFDFESWVQEAKAYIDDLDKISTADLMTLRRLLSYHRHNGSEHEYWEDLALNGHLIRILRRFEELCRQTAAKTPVS